MTKIKRAIIWPDTHLPYHDQKAVNLIKSVAKDICPDEIVFLGDILDFYHISLWPKDPEIEGSLIDEIDCGIKLFTEIRDLFPKASIVYLEGNHEHRLTRFLNEKCAQLFGIINLPTLLHLEKLKIKFIPYGPSQRYNVLGSSLIARHEPLGGGVHCAYQSVTKAQKSMIFGHTHRIQEFQIVSIDGENYRGISSGWLGDKNHRVMQYVKSHHQWAQGFSVVTLMPSGLFFNQLVHIIDHQCWVDGKFYK